jgi:hypothetical protein
MPNELWIILKVFKNKLLAVTVKETNRYVDQFQQETTKKTKHCKGVVCYGVGKKGRQNLLTLQI